MFTSSSHAPRIAAALAVVALCLPACRSKREPDPDPGAATHGSGLASHGPGPALQILGDSYKHRRGDPLPGASAIFDGTRVRLRGVRGETLGVQVLLRGDPIAVGLAISEPAAKPDGAKPDGAKSDGAKPDGAKSPIAVHPFAVDWVHVKTPSTDLYGPSRGAGWYPDRLVPQLDGAPVTTDQMAFFDVAIAADAPAGVYRGQLTVGDRAIGVQLDVEPLAIDLRADPLVWAYYDSHEIASTHGVKPDSDEHLAWERRYADLMRAHGGYLSDTLTPESLDRRSAFTDGARYWPVYVDRRDRARFQADIARWIKVFADRPAIPFAILVDEPRDPAAQARVRQFGQWGREAGSGGDRFLLAVTAPPDPALGDDIDVFISWFAIPRKPEVARDARLWTYNGAPGHAGSVIVDTHGTALRTWGWIATRYDVPMWYVWDGLYFTDRYNGGEPNDPLRDPITFRSRADVGNGDGMLIYPGALPSLRLKALRRGLQDRLLLRRLAGCDASEAAAIAREMIPRALAEAESNRDPSWPVDEAPWEAARHRVLDALGARCPQAR